MSGGSWLPQASGIIIQQAKDLDNCEIELGDLSVRRLTTMYFVASHLYYRHDIPLMQDTIFDNLCKILMKKKFKKDVYNKPDKESLAAGTGFAIKYSVAIIQLSDYIRGVHEKPK